LNTTMAAVDLGAQSGRVATGSFDGDQIVVEEVHRFANVPMDDAGVLRWDFDQLCDEVAAGLRKQGQAGEISSVAVDSWAVDFGLLDADRRLLRNPVHYRDPRRANAYGTVLERIPARELYQRTGIQLLPINTIFELSALANAADEDLSRAERLLLIPDLFHHWLCGSETTELTNATTTQCYDVESQDWATDLLARLNVPDAILPDVVPPGTELGPVGSETADITGLGRARVIAGATHDTAAAVAAVPMSGGGCAYLSIGTWSLVGIESDRPIVTDASFAANLTNEGGVDGTYRVLRNITGLWLLHECRRTWAEQGRPYEFADLVELARSAEPLQCLIEPNDPSFIEPGDMPARIASYLNETNQSQPSSDAAVVRCVLESLALKHAETVELLVEVTGRTVEMLHVVGGGANNDLLCAWTAAAACRPVTAGPVEATLIGNLLLQARALGELSSLADGRELVRRSFALSRFDPTDEQIWVEARQRFAALPSTSPQPEVPV
jgi:rhamnulokinase